MAIPLNTGTRIRVASEGSANAQLPSTLPENECASVMLSSSAEVTRSVGGQGREPGPNARMLSCTGALSGMNPARQIRSMQEQA